jgi:hypothetical protein
MSQTIEWAHAQVPFRLVEGNEEAADGNTPNENGRDDYIAVTWEGIALYGTPLEVLLALTKASRAVAAYAAEKHDG